MGKISGRFRSDNCAFFTLVNTKTKRCDYEWFWMSSDEAYERNQWLQAYGSENLTWTTTPDRFLTQSSTPA